MIPKPIDQVGLPELEALKGLAREGKTLEFKRELPKGDAGAKKLVASVSGLANASGGDLAIGVVEQGGVAIDIPGIVPTPDPDGYKLKIEQALASLIEPALPRVDVQEIDCGGGRWAFVVRVQQSWIGPHRSRADNHFYVRTSGATVPLSVGELRTAFGLRESGVQRIEDFRTERLIKVMAGETPVPIHQGPAVVLHMAPLPSFANRDLLDIVSMVANGTHMPLPLRGVGVNRPQVNLLGLLQMAGGGVAASSYGQLFRSGAYEGVSCSSESGEERYLASIEFANMVVGAVRYFLLLQESYQIAFPTFAMLSLCNASGLMMRMPTEFGSGYYPAGPVTDNLIAFPEILLEGPNVDLPDALRPLLNIVWNAFGHPRCDMYTPQGIWKGVT